MPVDCKMVLSSFKSSLRKFRKFLCPLSFGQSFEELTASILLFPDLTKFKHIISWLYIYTCYFIYIIDGFFYPFIDTYFLPIPRSSVGRLIHEIHLMYGLAICEMVLLRTYFLYAKIRYGSSIAWFTLVKHVNKCQHPMIFKFSKYFFAQLYSSIVMTYMTNQMIK